MSHRVRHAAGGLMWLITGPFDDERPIEDQWSKTKLLKPGSTYGITRRPGKDEGPHLWLNNKKISSKNGQIIVEKHTKEDVSDPLTVPKLTLHNNKSLALKVQRSSESTTLTVNDGTTFDMLSGDTIKLTSIIQLVVTWSPIVCFSSDLNTTPIDKCASFGIKVVEEPQRDITHFITTEIPSPLSKSTPAMLGLLDQVHFVTPVWLTKFTSMALTETFSRPIESDFLPTVDPSLSSLGETVWAPNPGRANLFEGLRFIFVVIGSGIGTESKAIANTIGRGGGDRQVVDVEKELNGKSTWESVLRKWRTTSTKRIPSGCGLVLVADSEAMGAKGVPNDIRQAWDSMVGRAKDLGMRFICPSIVVESILKTDVTILDCKSQAVATPLQAASSQVESDAAQSESHPPRRRLTRRAASRTPAPAPSEPPAAPEPSTVPESVPEQTGPIEDNHQVTESQAPVKKVLRRRARNVAMEAPSQAPEEAAPAPESTQPVSQLEARPSRLVRRAKASQASQLQLADEESESYTKPLKKFKALFEGTMDSLPVESESSQISATEHPARLETLREEEEESQSVSASGDQTQKRQRDNSDGARAADENSPPRKRRAIQGSNAVEPETVAVEAVSSGTRPEEQTQAELQPGKASGSGPMDTDQSFLKAVASRKKSKRGAEDKFDREFNNLRISKPDPNKLQNATNTTNYWEGHDDFLSDVNIRGNFMRIIEIEVKPRDKSGQKRWGGRQDWEGREDFKKFQKKARNSHRVIVPLNLNEMDTGDSQAPHIEFNYAGISQPSQNADRKRKRTDDLGDELEDADRTGTQLIGPKVTLHTQTNSKPLASKSQSKRRIVEDEESQVVAPVRVTRAKPPSKAKSPTPIPASTTNVATRRKQFQPLFAPDTDDEPSQIPPELVRSLSGTALQDIEPSPTPDLGLTICSSSTEQQPGTQTTRESGTQGSRGVKRKPTVIEESGSDEEPTRRTRAKRRK